MKFSDIEFKVTLPKHNEGIGAVELIGVIKNTVSKSLSETNLIKLDYEELHTWLVLVIQKVNDRLLILGAPQRITITPNHICMGSGTPMEMRSTRRLLFNNNSTDGKYASRYLGPCGPRNSPGDNSYLFGKNRNNPLNCIYCVVQK